MSFHFPWIALTILVPLLGAWWARQSADPDRSRQRSLIVCGMTLFFSVAAGVDFSVFHGVEAHDPWDVFGPVLGGPAFVIDAVNAPLVPLAALVYLLTALATLRTKVRRFSFPRMLISEAILIATLSSKHPWAIVVLLAVGTIPPWKELRLRRKPTNVYVLHMLLFVGLLVGGQLLVGMSPEGSTPSILAISLLMAAVLVRSGSVPTHCWMTDLFEHATFGTALLFVTPMVGAYAAMRLVLPIAPAWALHAIAVLSLITAIYAACMALVQRDARRFFCYLFLSHSSLVLVGLETATALGLTGGLCVWLSVCLSLTGFGLTLRSIEARTGALSLNEYHGLFEHTPRLAALFLITGLASIGFPGTLGFVGTELLVDGAMQVHPVTGLAVVIGAALNGLAVLQAYFLVFTGTRHQATIDIRSRPSEKLAVMILAGLIIGGGLYPQAGVTSRYRAAMQLVQQRAQRMGPGALPEHQLDHSAQQPVLPDPGSSQLADQ